VRDRLVLGDVILAVGAKPVKDIDDLLGALEALKPGDAVKLWILRDGERVEVEVTLGQAG
jgi:S1-C subfamily serine protease